MLCYLRKLNGLVITNELPAPQWRGLSRRRVLSSGRATGGVAFTNGPLAYMLKNRVVLGELNHQGQSYPSEHPAIVETEFSRLCRPSCSTISIEEPAKGRSDALLTGCLYDDRGNIMSSSHALKKGVRYRYYVSTAAVQGRKEDAGSIVRVPAKEIGALVLQAQQDRSATDISDDAAGLRELIVRLDLRVVLYGDPDQTGGSRSTAQLF